LYDSEIKLDFNDIFLQRNEVLNSQFNMKIKFYKTLTRSTLEDIDRLATLLQDIGETDWAVLGSAVGLLHYKLGCLFVAYKGSEKVAYGFFSYGIECPQFRRLYYFAVETKFRGVGVGKKSILEAINREVDLTFGCAVTCNLSLQAYYENLGFKFLCSMKDKRIKQVDLLLSGRSIDSIRQEERVTHVIEVNSDFLYLDVPNIEKEFGLKLLQGDVNTSKIG